MSPRPDDFCNLTVNDTVSAARGKLFPCEGYDKQLAFVRSPREGRDPEVTVRDGLRATVVCLAILEACRSGQPQAGIWRARSDEDPGAADRAFVGNSRRAIGAGAAACAFAAAGGKNRDRFPAD